MRIALVTDAFYPQVGGTEKVVDSLASSYVKMGHDVEVFTQDYKIKKLDDSKLGYKVYRTKSYKFPFYPLIPLPYKEKKLNQELSKFNPNVIHAHTPFEMGYWAMKMAKELHIPSVLTTHTYLNYINEQNVPFSKANFIHKLMVNLATKMPKKTAHIADALTAVSKSVADAELVKVYKESRYINIIHNGFDYSKLSEALKSKNTSPLQIYKDSIDNILHICFVGRIVKEKNLEFSLNVCKILKDRHIPFDFTLAGEGDVPFFLSIAKNNNIESNVKFIGKKCFENLIDLYSKSDCLLFPSIFDCDSIVGIESRALGCPTFVIKDTGSAERIENNINGFILENNPKIFADKLEELYLLKKQHTDSYMTLRERTLNKKVLSWEEISNEYINLYKNC